MKKDFILFVCVTFIILLLVFAIAQIKVNEDKDEQTGEMLKNIFACYDGCLYAVCKDNSICRRTNSSAEYNKSISDYQVCSSKCFNKYYEVIE